ncbi:hypothetical protein IMSAG049_00272 [Clostridiales bacterium]|nr:hypothetical protein IMSAG049_00272 [Clostridiales bacterium]
MIKFIGGIILKRLAVLLCSGIFSLACTIPAIARQTEVVVDGSQVVFPDAQPFVDENRRRLVPVRPVADAMGLMVSWDEKSETASFTRRYTNGPVNNWLGEGDVSLTLYKVEFKIGDSTYNVSVEVSDGNTTKTGGWTKMMDTAAVIEDGRTYVPVRYLAEEFGYAVKWDGETDTALLESGAEMGPRDENADFIESIIPNVKCLHSCITEVFLAELTHDENGDVECYFGLYTDEEAYDDGNGTPAVLTKTREGFENYFDDPTQSDYMPVTNFKTNADVRDGLRKYMADNVIDKWFHNDFFEYEGTLYMRRGSRGYGAVTCDMDSLKYLRTENGKQYITVDTMIFDQYYNTEVLEFTKIDGRWIITDEYEVQK